VQIGKRLRITNVQRSGLVLPPPARAGAWCLVATSITAENKDASWRSERIADMRYPAHPKVRIIC